MRTLEYANNRCLERKIGGLIFGYNHRLIESSNQYNLLRNPLLQLKSRRSEQ